ncbi:MAG: hypothetical protein ACR2IV_21630 [Bryobacteraceae bacterium]
MSFACATAWLMWMFHALEVNLTDTVVTRPDAEQIFQQALGLDVEVTGGRRPHSDGRGNLFHALSRIRRQYVYPTQQHEVIVSSTACTN